MLFHARPQQYVISQKANSMQLGFLNFCHFPKKCPFVSFCLPLPPFRIQLKITHQVGLSCLQSRTGFLSVCLSVSSLIFSGSFLSMVILSSLGQLSYRMPHSLLCVFDRNAAQQSICLPTGGVEFGYDADRCSRGTCHQFIGKVLLLLLIIITVVPSYLQAHFLYFSQPQSAGIQNH